MSIHKNTSRNKNINLINSHVGFNLFSDIIISFFHLWHDTVPHQKISRVFKNIYSIGACRTHIEWAGMVRIFRSELLFIEREEECPTLLSAIEQPLYKLGHTTANDIYRL